MGFLIFLSTYMIPFVIFYVVGYGLLKKRNVYEVFVRGAADGFQTVIRILPTLIGLMVAAGVLRASGFLNFLTDLFKDILSKIGFPSELLPLTLVRMFSNSAATGLALDIFKSYGPDSYLGILSSLLLSSTETIFYTLSIYFMMVKIKHIRYTLAGALIATLGGIAASVVLAGRM